MVFCSALTQQARPTDRKRPALPGQTQVRNQMWLGTPHLGRPPTTIGPFLSWVPALVSPSMYPCSSACRLRVLLVLSESAVLPNVPSSVPSPLLRACLSILQPTATLHPRPINASEIDSFPSPRVSRRNRWSSASPNRDHRCKPRPTTTLSTPVSLRKLRTSQCTPLSASNIFTRPTGVDSNRIPRPHSRARRS